MLIMLKVIVVLTGFAIGTVLYRYAADFVWKGFGGKRRKK